MEIAELTDGSLDRGLEGAVAVRRAVDAEVLPDDPPVVLAEVRAEITAVSPDRSDRWWLATDGAEPLGLIRADRNLVGGNENVVELSLDVTPGHRRQGVGRALVAAAVAAQPAAVGQVLGWNLASDAYDAFWSRLCGPARYRERVSRLVVADVDPALMQRWIDRAAERAGDYELVGWEARCPDDLLDEYAVAKAALNDAPTGELDIVDEVWTAERVRNRERRLECYGFRSLVLAAVHRPSGRIGGYTEVVVNGHRPSIAYQGDTAVLADHRRRGLGRWLKAAAWQRLGHDHGAVATVDTENADDNEAMLAINVEMGFRPLVTYAAWQADRASVEAALPPP